MSSFSFSVSRENNKFGRLSIKKSVTVIKHHNLDFHINLFNIYVRNNILKNIASIPFEHILLYNKQIILCCSIWGILKLQIQIFENSI